MTTGTPNAEGGVPRLLVHRLRGALVTALTEGSWSQIADDHGRVGLAWRDDLKPGWGKPKYVERVLEDLPDQEVIALGRRTAERFSRPTSATLNDALSSASQIAVEDLAGAIALVEVEDRTTGEVSNGTGFHIGGGIFVTAAHVVENKNVRSISTTVATTEAREPPHHRWSRRVRHAPRSASDFRVVRHVDPAVDAACIKTDLRPGIIKLGYHSDSEPAGSLRLVLKPVVVMGYPKIPCIEPTLVCTRGEINALVAPFVGPSHPHFLISPTARGGFSGGPVILVETGKCLGVVTQAFVADGKSEESGFFAVLTMGPILEMLEKNELLPDDQADVRDLLELLAWVNEQQRLEQEGLLPERPPTFYIRGLAADGAPTLIDSSEDRDEMFALARSLAAAQAAGPYGPYVTLLVLSSKEDDALLRLEVPENKPK